MDIFFFSDIFLNKIVKICKMVKIKSQEYKSMECGSLQSGCFYSDLTWGMKKEPYQVSFFRN